MNQLRDHVGLRMILFIYLFILGKILDLGYLVKLVSGKAVMY